MLTVRMNIKMPEEWGQIEGSRRSQWGISGSVNSLHGDNVDPIQKGMNNVTSGNGQKIEKIVTLGGMYESCGVCILVLEDGISYFMMHTTTEGFSTHLASLDEELAIQLAPVIQTGFFGHHLEPCQSSIHILDLIGFPVNTSLIRKESHKLPTAVLFNVDTSRISIRHCEILKSITLNVLARSDDNA
ncbi:hypothetical protein Tco_0411220 [Tanacetum coccineum]